MWYSKTNPGLTAGARRTSVMSLAVAAVATAGLAGRAGAAVTVYSNVAGSSFTGDVFPFPPYNTVTTVGTGTYASLVADDITPVSGYAGEAVSSLTFTAYNGSDTPVTAVADLRFYAADGAGGGPGTLLFGYDTGAFSLDANASAFEPVTLPTVGSTFNLPSGTFYAGVSFSDGGGTTGATADQLANLGQVVFDPPTLGSSADSFFQSSGAGLFLTNNPAGDPTNSFGGSPAANFGWQFNVTGTAVPEPASAGLLGTAAVAALARRRRRA